MNPSNSIPAAARSGHARRVAAAAATAAATVLAAAGVASAHVTVNPREAQQGSYSKVDFRMPNEMDNTTTDKLEVVLPTDHPIASVSVEPVYGWTVAVEKTHLTKPIASGDGKITDAVTKITWTADKNGKLQPGQFQDFGVSLGPLPTDTPSLTFKALQTYSNGQIVRWIDLQQSGRPEPAHPAPVLTLTKAAAGDGQDGAGTSAAPAAPAADTSAAGTPSTQAAVSSDDSTARTLGVVGIVVGVVGAAVGVGFGMYGMRRRDGSAS